MRALYVLLIASVTSTFFSAIAHAGAWVQPAGGTQVIGNVSYFSGDRFFDRQGDRIAQPRYDKIEFQPYVEYGVTSNLTVGGTASLQRDQQSGLTNTGIADPELFMRKQLWKDTRHVVSIQPTVKFPSVFEDSGAPRGGSRSTDIELALLYGQNVTLFSPRDYLDIKIGYRYRTTELDDQIRADAALGLEIAKDIQLVPAMRTILATDTANNSFSQNGNQDFTLIRAELGVLYQWRPKQTIGLTLFNHVDGRQAGDGSGATLSIAQQF